MRNVWMQSTQQTQTSSTKHMIIELMTAAAQAGVETAPAAAAIKGNIASAAGLLGGAIGVGMAGSKAVEAVGRNPGAFGNILVIGIIAMALAEGLGVMALFLAQP
jgi:F-type H+-transporting ATPase subunit c